MHLNRAAKNFEFLRVQHGVACQQADNSQFDESPAHGISSKVR